VLLDALEAALAPTHAVGLPDDGSAALSGSPPATEDPPGAGDPGGGVGGDNRNHEVK